jgi:hypothetical protein
MRKKSRSASGFILADVLAALVIAAIALSTLLTGVTHAAKLVSVQGERIVHLVTQENDGASKTMQVLAVGE